ncbi:uncharacterized protein SCHCODRAFT_02639737 [Schizophyllum commune H4-8]|uniref:uncharacterized protein n=1 Tax=Schizophyllum commune (strain H4-8 / FGSC 9210) TaxID=578458 RepID=UPI002160FB70|nr:uncharacterized protein SCHCODRAFT_02639737 [Schizophyllum commune H4-8]KAI5888098.1 hypothetical protein SCHCODRAFT_02639737 [Schizophyllum commune H4-8]
MTPYAVAPYAWKYLAYVKTPISWVGKMTAHGRTGYLILCTRFARRVTRTSTL